MVIRWRGVLIVLKNVLHRFQFFYVIVKLISIKGFIVFGVGLGAVTNVRLVSRTPKVLRPEYSFYWPAEWKFFRVFCDFKMKQRAQRLWNGRQTGSWHLHSSFKGILITSASQNMPSELFTFALVHSGSFKWPILFLPYPNPSMLSIQQASTMDIQVKVLQGFATPVLHSRQSPTTTEKNDKPLYTNELYNYLKIASIHIKHFVAKGWNGQIIPLAELYLFLDNLVYEYS